jgi:hypothetical protein
LVKNYTKTVLIAQITKVLLKDDLISALRHLNDRRTSTSSFQAKKESISRNKARQQASI